MSGTKFKVNDIVRMKYTTEFYDKNYVAIRWKIIAITEDGDNSAIIENLNGEQNTIEMSKLVLYN